jgi:hypothetical protein
MFLNRLSHKPKVKGFVKMSSLGMQSIPIKDQSFKAVECIEVIERVEEVKT